MGTGPWAVERTMEAFQYKWPRWRLLTSTAAHRGVLFPHRVRYRADLPIHPGP
jgi:hypothetical protein